MKITTDSLRYYHCLLIWRSYIFSGTKKRGRTRRHRHRYAHLEFFSLACRANFRECLCPEYRTRDKMDGKTRSTRRGEKEEMEEKRK